MKSCPTCQRTYEDDAQKFCANDGTQLVSDEAPAFDPEATVMSLPRPLLEEQPPVDEPSQAPLPPTQYFTSGSGPSSQPEQNIHQSYPPPASSSSSPTPGAPPAWPPAQQQQQQQPYYPQQGMAGGGQQQPPQAPPWQGGQPPQQQQNWTPQGQQPPQGQNWGGGAAPGGGYYPQPPGQYAPYGAGAAVAEGGKNKAALASLILGLISFVAMVAVFIIVGARIYDLRDLIEPLFYGGGALAGLALVLGIIALITGKAGSGKGKAIVGIVLSVISSALFLLVLANMR